MSLANQRIIALISVIACAPTETARESRPRVDTTTVAALPVAGALPAPPGDTTAVAALPARFIADIPGWLGLGLRFLNQENSDPTDDPAVGRLGIFPQDTAWKHVGRATPLVVIGDSGRATFFPEGVTDSDPNLGNQTVLRVGPSTRIDARWIVPQSEADDIAYLPIGDSLSADKLTRIWTAGEARIRLQRTDRRSARMVGEFHGHVAARKDLIGINPSADSSMGVETTDSILDLKKAWMIPTMLGALRFGTNGSIVVIFAESGYECMNIRVVVFRSSGIEWIEEPHFYGYCTH